MNEVKLNLGCAWRNYGADWVHIDGGDYPHLHSKDIVNLPFEDNSVDLIYASHVLEYFDRVEVIDVLNEWKRVLKVGGRLQVCVPDFEKLIEVYQKNSYEMIDGTLFGRMFMGDKVIYHKTCYDWKSLKALLISVGFHDMEYFDSPHHDYSQAVKPKLSKNPIKISLNVECVK